MNITPPEQCPRCGNRAIDIKKSEASCDVCLNYWQLKSSLQTQDFTQTLATSPVLPEHTSAASTSTASEVESSAKIAKANEAS